MAIDTENKLRSIHGYNGPWAVVYPEADGVIDAADREHAAGLYAGIPAAAPVVPPPPVAVAGGRRGGAARPQRLLVVLPELRPEEPEELTEEELALLLWHTIRR